MKVPPLGVLPYYLAAQQRISVLAQAIDRYAHSGRPKSSSQSMQDTTWICHMTWRI